MTRTLPLSWTIGHSPDEHIAPVRRVPAEVPGAVQLDWARAENWQPYWHGQNANDYRWMEDAFWTYRTEFPKTELQPHQCMFVVCGGVDYRFVVRLDGRIVHTQEGMFTPWEVDVTAHAARGAVLEVMVFPAPKAPHVKSDLRQARASAKPAVSYGWDFHPRLIPLGIWEETRLEIRPTAHLRDAELRYHLHDDFALAELSVDVEVSHAAIGRSWRWTLFAPSGEAAYCEEFALESSSMTRTAPLASPQLWWPRGHGPQPLYISQIELLEVGGAIADVRRQRVGFRRARLVLPAEVMVEPPGFPKTRRPAPTTFEINGRRIFAKGSNWVSPEIFPGIITAETYRPLLQLAFNANFNLLRTWGGAPVPKESFFDRCDELGLLVWQEFPLACNPYPDAGSYLRVLDQESRSIIRRVRRHACLALWSGGNELFNSWSGMDDQALPLRLLNRNCYDLDPHTPFIPTSPIEGVGHGDYRFRDENGREIFALFSRARCTAYPEFGCPGPAPATQLRSFIPAEEIWPPQPGGSWSMHHGFGAWDAEPTTWLCLATQRYYFDAPANLDELVARGDWLQSEGLKCLFEEARRQHPRCGMALNWCFNEPWPAAANNSLVHWPAHPKPALTAVAAACRSVLSSARIPKFSWQAGETFSAELWLLNDRPEPRAAVSVHPLVHIGHETLPLPRWDAPAVAAATNTLGPMISFVLPAVSDSDELILELKVAGNAGLDSRYRLHYRSGSAIFQP